MPTSEADEALFARFIERGDDAAFTELVRRHEDAIFGLAYRMTGDRADALDATQDTFVAVFRKAHSFRGQSAFKTWLYRIGINACKDLLRKRGHSAVPEADLPDEPNAAVDVEHHSSLRLDLAAALQMLPEDYRTAVVMHDIGGFPYDEIARLTGTNIGTIKSRISRGRKRLAEVLEQPAEAQASND